NKPSPPVERRSVWLQPPSGPREGCDEFQECDGGVSSKPVRSIWPTIAVPCVLLVQFLQVLSSPGGKARPSGIVPVSASCLLGVSPRPLPMPALVTKKLIPDCCAYAAPPMPSADSATAAKSRPGVVIIPSPDRCRPP